MTQTLTRLMASATTFWSITSVNTGSLGNVSTNTTNVLNSFKDVANLSGGSMNDTFTFGANGSIAGNLIGGLGSNTLDETAVPNSVVKIKGKGTDVGLMGTATGIGGTLGFDDITKLTGFTTLAGPDSPIFGTSREVQAAR